MASDEERDWRLCFYDCVRRNNMETVQILVKRHRIDLNAKFIEVRKKHHVGMSPIHMAANKGHCDMLQYLYDRDCDIHLNTTMLCRTAFHMAVLQHRMACIHKLLSFGANPEVRDTFGNTPCHYAAEDGALHIMDILFQHQVDVNAQDITMKTPLMKATSAGKTSAMERLLGAGCDLNLQNQWGHTALIEAVCYNNKNASSLLLDAGCSLNAQEFKRGDTALHIAVKNNYNVMVNQLLSTGRVQHLYNNLGELALYDAVLNQKLNTIKIFVDHNCDLDSPVKINPDGSSQTAADVAMLKSYSELLHLLSRLSCVMSMSRADSGSMQNQFEQGLHVLPSSTASSHSTRAPCERSCSQMFQVHRQTSSSPYLNRVLIDVCSLKELSRKIVRKHIGFGIHSKVSDLGIPRFLQEYLLLKELL